MAYSATLVSHGSGAGIAIATGDSTQIGAINMLVSRVEKKKTNVLKQIDQVSKLLALLIGIATLVTFFIAKFESKQDTFEAASTALVVSYICTLFVRLSEMKPMKLITFLVIVRCGHDSRRS